MPLESQEQVRGSIALSDVASSGGPRSARFASLGRGTQYSVQSHRFDAWKEET